MNDRFQRESIGDGVWFSSVTDPKFKHNRISANLLVGLESETASVNAALPFILRRGCRSCPDFTMLNQKLCELYGASLSCDVSKFGGYQVLELSIYGIDDRFTLDNAPLARECAALLCDVLLDPKLSDGAFDEQDTALERQQLVDTIEGQIMFVDSGVEKQNGRKAYDEILRQLDCVRRGEFTDEELTATRLLMQTSLEAVGDSLSATEEWYLTQIVGGAQYSAKDESALLDEVTREDVIAAAGQVTLDTVYFLTGKEAE